MVGLAAECPLCDQELEGLPGWETAPENAIAIHLQGTHPGWERTLGFFADVLDTLDARPALPDAPPADVSRPTWSGNIAG